MREVMNHLKSAFRMPQGQRVAPAQHTKLGEDGNQMPADGNSVPEFILGWTIGAIGVCRRGAKLVAQCFSIKNRNSLFGIVASAIHSLVQHMPAMTFLR